MMLKVLKLMREYWALSLVPMGFVMGWWLDRRNDERLTSCRNRSMLFRRELKPGEEVTWK
ncbi:NADH dehydrogenase [ubiquinone] 1 beta subcomplex subunit 1 [Alligator mississippiensis]|uniref:NADH dehydrogenase [ubiquinone] 1 beta subcomplex subunit 1 n=1 Tax=Alligator mississippiensis TaxID=8496 RepID=UPI0003D07926|nr:NADH dehydrogenase [ubiquinone] 1 beta subcomplex subunit 1 [Alligator mississippiensis]